MDVTEKTAEFQTGTAVIPVNIVAEPEVAEGADGHPGKKKASAAKKILSFFFSLIFCGASLLYMALLGLEIKDRLSSESVGDIVSEELFGAVRTERKDEATETVPEETAAAVPSETEAATEAVGTSEEPTDTSPPAVSYPIVGETLANYDLLTDTSNETAYSPDMTYLLAAAIGTGKCGAIYEEYGSDAPVVLIVHTHGTEAYAPEGKDTYTEEEPFRSDDTSVNVVSVGDVIAEVLEREGINTIHCREMFDAESYRNSYSKSCAAVASYLEDYPSIAYVFDVHRDSVIRDDKTNVATLAYFGERRIAQTMIVVGTDEGGADHPDWEENLSLALSIQKNMIGKADSMPRKINLRCAAFNQGLCSGSLLLEIGSCGNTLGEAKAAAVLTAMSVAEAVKGEACPENAADMISLFAPQ